MATEQQEEEEAQESRRIPINQIELAKSYLLFARHALKHRKLVAGLTFATIMSVTIALLVAWPRTYHCESTILVQGSGALIGGDGNAFRGASDILRRRENLQRIIRDTDLARRSIAERGAIVRFKDRLLGRGEMRPEDLEAGLVWTVEAALWVTQKEETLTFGADWRNPETVAALVANAQKVYLEARHISEISTIQEKIAIMEGHAIKVRKEIDSIAEQLKNVREEKIATVTNPAPAAPPSSAEPPAPRAPRARPPIKLATAVTTAISDAEQSVRKEQIATLKEDLEAKKSALKELKGQRTQNLATAQAQKSELLTKYTPAHPEVVVLERKIQSLSEESPRIAPLENEISQLNQKIKELEQAPTTDVLATRSRGGGGGGGATSAAQPKTEALPADILRLLDSSAETDPAVTVQLQGAIGRYATLRDGIRTAQVDLDTAQAAFQHRYKILSPPEAPLKPSKPNVPTMAFAGFFAALLLSLILPMVLELRRGTIVERWQVYQMNLPILAELRLPSGSRD